MQLVSTMNPKQVSGNKIERNVNLPEFYRSKSRYSRHGHGDGSSLSKYSIQIEITLLLILLTHGYLLQGNPENFEISVTDNEPYLEVGAANWSDQQYVDGALKYFSEYATAIKKLIDHDLPRLVEEAADLPGAASRAKDNAQGEIDALGVMDKAKCGAAIVSNTSELTKFPEYVKGNLEKLQKELKDMIDTVKRVKAEMPKLKTAAAECQKKDVKFAPQCYVHAYGPIQ